MPFKGDPSYAPAWLKGRPGRAWNAGSDAIARTLKRSRTARRIDPGRRLGIVYEELELRTDDGATLAAWFVPAAPDAPDRGDLMAVVHHHYGGQKATALPWIELLWRLGVPCIAFDGRGHAASGATPQGKGSFVQRGADVVAATAELRRRGARRILGVGQSQGAASLVIAIGGRPEVAGVILDSGPTPDMATAAWGLSGNMLGSRGRREPWTRALLAARILPGTQPVHYLPILWRRLHQLRAKPLLWIHGDRDMVVERRWSSVWYRALAPRSGRWQAEIVPGADHVRCLQVGGEALQRRVEDFVDRLEG